MTPRAAFAAILKDRQILLVRSLTSIRYSNHWSLPGGIIESGESPEEAARREALEETGIVCRIGKLLTTIENTEDRITVSIFQADYVSGEIVLEVHEIAEARWFKLEDALELPLAYDLELTLKSLI
jgi:mutator protein MutT